ncbi:hypothetical protein N0A02_26700 [Paraburkholderia acidicola]|uniref:Glycosyl transferase family 1 domain-containing protein n=1 Tax=Paraburkholderia acidicola TaxID=1912599 RepID=A0ABV1LUV1_9BURK
MRIIYFCTSPGPGEHAGGVKVIYDHAHALTAMGIEAFVLPHRRGYEYPWSGRCARVISDKEIRQSDHLVLPEIKAASIARCLVTAGIRYSIFVQNGYYLRDRDKDCSDADVDFAYANATSVLSISADTSALILLHYPELSPRIVNVFCSVNPSEFAVEGEKRNVITYMPRKNGPHAAAVVFALKKCLPSDWQIQAIDGLNESGVAQLLRTSRIFMSFSGLEGLGLPPVEAALCGNYVVGYHGGGGREYWREPNFDAVDTGDIATFVKKVTARVRALSHETGIDALMPGIDMLQTRYSMANEQAGLRRFVEAIATGGPQGIASRTQSRGALVKLQKRQRLSGWFRARRTMARKVFAVA